MAGGRIAGITIEIGGDTQKLNKALSGVNKDINATQKELKDVNKLLKLDPKNTTLLSQKQKLLGQQIGDTKNKLQQLKAAEEQARQALEKGEIGQKEFDALQREIIDTENKLKSLEKEAKNIPDAFSKMSEVGEKLKGVGSVVEETGKKFLPITGAVTGFGAAAVKVTSDFDTSMSQVQATLGVTKDSMSDLNGESVNTMDALGDLAKQMGSETAFSATECGNAINFLALAGYSTQEIYDTLPSVLNLAAAGGMDLAAASDMVTDSMSALGIETKDADGFVDQMAKTASNSNTSVAQLGNAILAVGGTAKVLKGGTTELNTALGILADNGIKGAEGGTKLRNILLKLNPTTKKAIEAWEDLGISAYDADGNMRPLEETFSDLKEKMSDMSDQEKTATLSKMFNAPDLKAVNALLATSTTRWEELGSAIDDSKGAAQEMADTQLDNLEGKITILKSAVEGLAIQFGEILMPYIIKIVGKVQSLVEWFSNLNSGTKKIIITVAGIAAVIGPLLIVIGKTLIFVGQVMTFLPKIKAGVTAVTTAIGGISGPVLIAIGVVTALIAAGVLLYKNWDKIKAYAIKLVDVLKNKFTELKKKITEVFNSIKSTVTTIWSNIQTKISTIVDKIKATISDKFNSIKTKVSNIVDSIKTTISDKFNTVKDKVKTIFDKVKENITKPFTTAKDNIEKAIDSIKEKIGSVKEKLKGLADLKWLHIPKISVTWKELAFGVKKPSFSIDWHAKAMSNPYMLDGATIFGAAGGNLLGGGEIGKEMIYGHANLLQDIRNVVDQSALLNAVGLIINILDQYLPQKQKIVLDTGALVGSTVSMYDVALGRLARRR